MIALRLGLVATGLAVGLFGLKLLLEQGGENLVAAGSWLIGGVVLHDGVLAPAVIVFFFLVTRLVRGSVPGPVVIGGLVLGSVTLLALPTILRLGEIKDNTSLLDRNYTVGWFVFAGLTLAAVGAALLRKRLAKGGAGGASTGRR